MGLFDKDKMTAEEAAAEAEKESYSEWLAKKQAREAACPPPCSHVMTVGVSQLTGPDGTTTTNAYLEKSGGFLSDLDEGREISAYDFIGELHYPLKTMDPESLKDLRKEGGSKFMGVEFGDWCGLGPFNFDPWDFLGIGGSFDAEFTGEFNWDWGALSFRWISFGPPCPLPPVGVGPPPFKNNMMKDLYDAFRKKSAKEIEDERKRGPMDNVGDYIMSPGALADMKFDIPTKQIWWDIYDILLNRLSLSALLNWICTCFGDLELATVPWVDIDVSLGGGGSLGY